MVAGWTSRELSERCFFLVGYQLQDLGEVKIAPDIYFFVTFMTGVMKPSPFFGGMEVDANLWQILRLSWSYWLMVQKSG